MSQKKAKKAQPDWPKKKEKSQREKCVSAVWNWNCVIGMCARHRFPVLEATIVAIQSITRIFCATPVSKRFSRRSPKLESSRAVPAAVIKRQFLAQHCLTFVTS
jgi:hypothetical protein